jgi:hypothetical protein
MTEKTKLIGPISADMSKIEDEFRKLASELPKEVFQHFVSDFHKLPFDFILGKGRIARQADNTVECVIPIAFGPVYKDLIAAYRATK